MNFSQNNFANFSKHAKLAANETADRVRPKAAAMPRYGMGACSNHLYKHDF